MGFILDFFRKKKVMEVKSSNIGAEQNANIVRIQELRKYMDHILQTDDILQTVSLKTRFSIIKK